MDTAFIAVVEACADPDRPGAWITRAVVDAYVELHRLGWAHSVETWTSDNRLAGGLYGVAISLFAGGVDVPRPRAMGTRRLKVALVALADLVSADGLIGRLIDVQWVITPANAGRRRRAPGRVPCPAAISPVASAARRLLTVIEPFGG